MKLKDKAREERKSTKPVLNLKTQANKCQSKHQVKTKSTRTIENVNKSMNSMKD